MAKIDLDSLTIEEVAALRDNATDKLAEKVAARRAELEAEQRRRFDVRRSLSQYVWATGSVGFVDHLRRPNQEPDRCSGRGWIQLPAPEF